MLSSDTSASVCRDDSCAAWSVTSTVRVTVSGVRSVLSPVTVREREPGLERERVEGSGFQLNSTSLPGG